jgi:hypothetical protein
VEEEGGRKKRKKKGEEFSVFGWQLAGKAGSYGN